MECDLKKIKEIVLNIKMKGVGSISPQEAAGYLVCLKGIKTEDKNLAQEINELLFQLEGQAKIGLNDYKDYQKRQQIVDLILRLDKKTRELFIEKGLDAMVLITNPKMRNYLEEIMLVLNSMGKKPNLDEVVNMFRTPEEL